MLTILKDLPLKYLRFRNVRREPIVNTPEDAFISFMGTELDKSIIY